MSEKDLLPTNSEPKELIPLSEAVIASIKYVISQPDIGFPYEKTHQFAYNLYEVVDDTDYSREKSITVEGEEYLFLVARKTINFVGIRVYHYPEQDHSKWDVVAGYYKFAKTILTLGTERLFNCLACKFDPITSLPIADGRRFVLYSSSINLIGGTAITVAGILLYPVYIFYWFLYRFIDPIDIHDATWEKHVEYIKEKEAIGKGEMVDNNTTPTIPESNPVIPNPPVVVQEELLGPNNV